MHKKVADKLTAQFPDKKALIAQNLSDFNRTLAEQSEKITAQLANVKDKGFLRFPRCLWLFQRCLWVKTNGLLYHQSISSTGCKKL